MRKITPCWLSNPCSTSGCRGPEWDVSRIRSTVGIPRFDIALAGSVAEDKAMGRALLRTPLLTQIAYTACMRFANLQWARWENIRLPTYRCRQFAIVPRQHPQYKRPP